MSFMNSNTPAAYRHHVSHAVSPLVVGPMTGNERQAAPSLQIGDVHARSAYVDGVTDYYDQGVQFTNGFQTHHLSQRVGDDWVDGDTAPGQFLYLNAPADFPIEYDPHLHSYKMHSVGTLNQRLKYDPEWRHKYGSKTTIQAFKSDWKPFGVQQRDVIERKNGAWCDENNLIIGGRARMGANHHANAQVGLNQLKVGHRIYWLYRRYKYCADRVLSKEAWSNPSIVLENLPACGDEDMDEDDDDGFDPADEAPAVVGSMASRTVNDASGKDAFKNYESELKAALQGLLATGAKMELPAIKDIQARQPSARPSEEYYWQIEPWVSIDGSDPHPAIWTSNERDNAFVGDFEYIGVITHTIGGSTNACGSNSRSLARAVQYPKMRGKQYWEQLAKLPMIEVMLRAKHAHTLA